MSLVSSSNTAAPHHSPAGLRKPAPVATARFPRQPRLCPPKLCAKRQGLTVALRGQINSRDAADSPPPGRHRPALRGLKLTTPGRRSDWIVRGVTTPRHDGKQYRYIPGLTVPTLRPDDDGRGRFTTLPRARRNGLPGAGSGCGVRSARRTPRQTGWLQSLARFSATMGTDETGESRHVKMESKAHRYFYYAFRHRFGTSTRDPKGTECRPGSTFLVEALFPLSARRSGFQRVGPSPALSLFNCAPAITSAHSIFRHGTGISSAGVYPMGRPCQ